MLKQLWKVNYLVSLLKNKQASCLRLCALGIRTLYRASILAAVSRYPLNLFFPECDLDPIPVRIILEGSETD